MEYENLGLFFHKYGNERCYLIDNKVSVKKGEWTVYNWNVVTGDNECKHLIFGGSNDENWDGTESHIVRYFFYPAIPHQFFFRIMFVSNELAAHFTVKF